MEHHVGRTVKRCGQTMIGLLVVIVIILGVTIYFLYPSRQAKNSSQPQRSTATQVKDKAQDVVCQNNLRQIRMAIQADTMSGEPPPRSLAELHYPPESLRCPVGGEPYQYDPRTGQVHCVHPGHERF